jgi:hypothetical protein
VKPVNDGYRLVLTYNLIQSSLGAPQSAAIFGSRTQKLRSTLARWKKGYTADAEGCPSVLAYQLDHQYTNANLRFDLLKGDDQLIARYFREGCAEEGFSIYLANIVKEVTRAEDVGYGYGDEINDITDESLTLSNVIDLNGTVVIDSMGFNEDDIVQSDIFDRSSDEEKFEGYTGNEGAQTIHWYRDTVSFVCPGGPFVD